MKKCVKNNKWINKLSCQGVAFWSAGQILNEEDRDSKNKNKNI